MRKTRVRAIKAQLQAFMLGSVPKGLLRRAKKAHVRHRAFNAGQLISDAAERDRLALAAQQRRQAERKARRDARRGRTQPAPAQA